MRSGCWDKDTCSTKLSARDGALNAIRVWSGIWRIRKLYLLITETGSAELGNEIFPSCGLFRRDSLESRWTTTVITSAGSRYPPEGTPTLRAVGPSMEKLKSTLPVV